MRAPGGWLNVQSPPGRGTTATITLPLTNEVEERHGNYALERQESQRQPPSEVASTKIHILLVDDHAMVRQGLRTMLEEYVDIDVIGEAVDGEEAVLAVERLQPFVVIMDIR